VVVTSGSGIKDMARTSALRPAVTISPSPIQKTAVFHIRGAEPKYIQVFDHLGQPVRSLVNCNTWDGYNEKGQAMAPGVYLYRIIGETFITSGRMVKTQ
jgi:hypothetical protein